MAIKAAVIEKDSRFLDRLTAVFAKNYADKLEIYPYTDLEVALSTLEFVTPDILIADESIRIAAEDLPAECALAYFVSSVGTDRVDGHRAICKFQRAELIYKQIAGIVSDRGDSKFHHSHYDAFDLFNSIWYHARNDFLCRDKLVMR